MHTAAGAALFSYEPSRQALFAAVPIMVELISPPKIETRPEPPVEIAPPPKPRPMVKRMLKQPDPPPVVMAPPQAPSPIELAPPPPAPAPPPAPEPIAVAPPPVAVTAPIFTADYLDNPEPLYPMRSRRLGEQGRVLLRVLVNTAGAADDVQLRDSSGYPRLDQAALETVRRWRFVPARRGERPVPAWVLIPISFRLEG